MQTREEIHHILMTAMMDRTKALKCVHIKSPGEYVSFTNFKLNNISIVAGEEVLLNRDYSCEYMNLYDYKWELVDWIPEQQLQYVN